MERRAKNLLIISLTIVVLSLGLVMTAKAVNLQDAFNGQLSTVGTRSGFNTSQNNVEPIIGNIISVALSFLGVIFLILMVYGGYMWMTAAGNEEKAKKARQLIQAAILGLIVVVGAYAITVFIMGRLAKDLIPGDSSSTSGTPYDATSASDSGTVTIKGCCVTTNPGFPRETYTCDPVISNAFCNPALTGNPVYYDTPCPDLPQCQ